MRIIDELVIFSITRNVAITKLTVSRLPFEGPEANIPSAMGEARYDGPLVGTFFIFFLFFYFFEKVKWFTLEIQETNKT